MNALPATAVSPEISHWIGGRRVPGRSGRFAEVFHPSSGRVSGRVALAGEAEIDQAVRAAQDAFSSWSQVPPLQRARVMFKFRQLLLDNAERIAAQIASEHGKVIADARGELTRGMEVVEFATGIPQLLKGEHSENVGREVDFVFHGLSIPCIPRTGERSCRRRSDDLYCSIWHILRIGAATSGGGCAEHRGVDRVLSSRRRYFNFNLGAKDGVRVPIEI